MSENTFEPLELLKNSMDAVIEYELSRQNAEDTRESQPTAVRSKVPIYDEKCRECIKTMTDTMRYIHNYQEHSIPVPIADLATDTCGTDKILLRELQIKERDFK